MEAITTTTALAIRETPEALSQAIPLHHDVHWGAKPGDLTTLVLSDVRDHLQRERTFADPRWIRRLPAHVRVGFGDGSRRAGMREVSSVGGELSYGELHTFTDHGLKSLARHVLPAHGLKTINALCETGAAGAKVADLAWNQIATASPKPVELRTWNVMDPTTGRKVRAVRAAFTKYGEVDNLELVDELMDFDDLSSLPVLAYTKTDTAMRIRFALDPIDQFELGRPIRMVEAWNSEVGCRSVGLCGGLWWGKCTNGMASWEADNRWSWRHTGNVQRIRDGLPGAITEIKLKATGLAEQYEQSLSAAIDDAHGFMVDIFADTLTGEQIERASVALTDPTTARHSTGRPLLASVIDAVTLAAQAEIDLFRQQQMEGGAMQALRVGIQRANDPTDSSVRYLDWA